MISKRDIINTALDITGSRLDPSAKPELERVLNMVIVSESESHSWHKLRRVMEVDLSTSVTALGEEGVWLPGNLAGVDAVQDKDTGEFFIRRDTKSYSPAERAMKRYSVYTPDSTPLFWSDDLRISKGSDTIDCPTLGSDDYTGQWVRIGDEPMTYQLTAPTTIYPKYWGEDQVDVNIVIRPETTQKLVVHDSMGQKTSGKVLVYYWTYHPLMYRDSDMLLFPFPRYIVLLMAREQHGLNGRRSRNPINDEIPPARRESIRLNPHFEIPAHPLNRVGHSYDPAQLTYGSRNRTRAQFTKPLNLPQL